MATALLILAGSSTNANAADDTDMLLKDALSAAPPALRDKVTVVDWNNNVLQQGTSNYTCFPTPPQLSGTAPMCMDAAWMDWADAWMNKKPFEAKTIGISYMLAGDGGASNVDPYAEGMTDDNQWVVEGPHLMIITPDKAMLDALPTDPNNGGPYVMWKGTPYAHIMVPVGARP
ncbi:hypothetical protein CAG65_04940 [Vibrio sp. V39_P1S14PM300]|nr:hypothetical protein [Vibrio sp. V36_P2S2PM302]NAX20546.1 hypothetical protein [Vibrio sp. V39_P1S14PM300]NAX24586.1 hypothetical protein [Vibrio sp. V38_P2S17PM301]NAX28701.1 hypothetical protein [Vibrio sp. V37_P2S8PM304]